MSRKGPPELQRPPDHRARVGEERREKTRSRLLRGALSVFARHGVDARVIDRVIQEAGVARGTFYNYFRTNEELFLEVAREVSNEIIGIVEPLVQRQSDPAARIACGVNSVLRLAIAFPVFAQFVVKGGPLALAAGSLATQVVPRDIVAGIASGRFSVTDPKLAFDLVLGPVIMGFQRVLAGEASPRYAQELSQAVLQSLGVSKAQAQKYAAQDWGSMQLDADSLFAQASLERGRTD